MKFFTKINIGTYPEKMEHFDSIFTIGSCFAENIGEKFSVLKFNSMINPFGVLYNSESIKNSLKLITDQKVFSEDDLVFDQAEWHSFYHHSDFSHHKKETVLSKINSTSASVYSFLKNVDWFIISLGTSYVYRHKETGILVSNCHKIPQKEFTKIFLTLDENYYNIKNIIELQLSLNGNTKFLLTVSPVRHFKDGAHNNQLSKASLLLAVNKIVNDFSNAYYFPSYEIMIDELRDYRYYDVDLLHPNMQAINYIWEKFSECLLTKQCQTITGEIQNLVNAANHRVRNIYSQKNIDFAKTMLTRIKEIESGNSYINFEKEKQIFLSYINESKEK